MYIYIYTYIHTYAHTHIHADPRDIIIHSGGAQDIHAAHAYMANQEQARAAENGVTFSGVEVKKLTARDKIRMMMRGEPLEVVAAHADTEAGPPVVDGHKRLISAEDVGIVTTRADSGAGPLDGYSRQSMRHLLQVQHSHAFVYCYVVCVYNAFVPNSAMFLRCFCVTSDIVQVFC